MAAAMSALCAGAYGSHTASCARWLKLALGGLVTAALATVPVTTGLSRRRTIRVFSFRVFTWMMPDAGATRRRAETAAVPKRSSNGRPGRPTRPFASRVNASAMRASCSLLYGSHVPSGF